MGLVKLAHYRDNHHKNSPRPQPSKTSYWLIINNYNGLRFLLRLGTIREVSNVEMSNADTH